MATTGELATWVTQSKTGWARENDVIPIIRDVVNIFCKVENAQFLIIDPATGRPPLLATTPAFGPYNGPAGSWRVSNILIKEPIEDYFVNLDYNNEFGERPWANTTDRITINGNWYYPQFFVKTTDALEGGLPQIWFSRDPGLTTTRWYMQAYRTPTQITSDQVQLPIPDSYGAHRLYLLPACLALIEAIDHGNYQDSLAYIEGTLKPQMWKVLNKGAQGKRHRVTPRPY